MRRRRSLDEPDGPAVPVPQHLRWPVVEDWVSFDETDLRPRLGAPPSSWSAEDQMAWCAGELATERWRSAVLAWLREHAVTDLGIVERRAWKLGIAIGGQRCRMRDREAFLALSARAR